MLDSIPALDGEGEVSGAALGHPDHEGALVFVAQQLLCVRPRDAAVVPVVRFHLDVVARYQAYQSEQGKKTVNKKLGNTMRLEYVNKTLTADISFLPT